MLPWQFGRQNALVFHPHLKLPAALKINKNLVRNLFPRSASRKLFRVELFLLLISFITFRLKHFSDDCLCRELKDSDKYLPLCLPRNQFLNLDASLISETRRENFICGREAKRESRTDELPSLKLISIELTSHKSFACAKGEKKFLKLLHKLPYRLPNSSSEARRVKPRTSPSELGQS